MTPITIPPAALKAGARAICDANGWPHSKAMFCDEVARAAFLAMVKAWPNGNLHVPVGAGQPRKSFTLPALILPLTEKPDGE